jgi:ferrous-iron efflux pump FieF
LSDVAANLAVLLALSLAKLTGWQRFDPLFAIAIAAFFGGSAFMIARSAADTLLDHELSGEERQQVTQIVMAHRDARGMHDLRTRSSGLVRFIEFHLELDGSLSVQSAHRVADEIEHSLRISLPSSEVLVHVEPAGIHDQRLDY